MNKTTILFTLLGLFFCTQPVFTVRGQETGKNKTTPNAEIRYDVNDAHCHYNDFLMNTDGIDSLLAVMDMAGVEHTMLNGIAVVKKWDAIDPVQPMYYLADDSRCYYYSAVDVALAREVSSLPTEQRRRIHPFIGGFNTTDRNAIDHVKRMMEWYPGLWEGIGEILTRHDDLTALVYGEQARANHIALDPVYQFAAENDLPVCVHSDISSVWVHEPLYLHEMEEAIQKHPNTRFIWAHAGISRRIVVPTIIDELRRMLTIYPNLSVDISWVVYPMDVAPDGVPSQDWVDMVEDFPDRFMIGTDKIGHYDDYVETITKYYIFLDALSPETAKLVAKDNFWNILPARVREKE